MDPTLTAFATALLATLIAGIGRALAGPSPGDRVLAAQLLGTGGVATLLVLSAGLAQPALEDVALVLVLLSAMATVVWYRNSGPGKGAR